jgi:hypothetical protein
MVDSEQAVGKNISLYPRQINAVKNFSESNSFKYDSEGYQYIIDDFFNRDNKSVKYDFIVFLVVPIIFCVLTTIVNISTDKVFNILLEQGLYFYDLYILSRVFMVLSFGSIGVLIACVYWLRRKIVNNAEMLGDGD